MCKAVSVLNRFIMAELLQTERAYVKDLETCITCYLREMRTDPAAVPSALQGKVITSTLRKFAKCQEKC